MGLRLSWLAVIFRATLGNFLGRRFLFRLCRTGHQMTIVVTVKINDGIVLAADSATTFSDQQGAVVKIYNNANKAFNLVKGLPIGGFTWGAGGIGSASFPLLRKT